MTEERQRELDQGAADIRALEEAGVQHLADWKASFWLEAGDEERAAREWAAVPPERSEGWINEHYVPLLYGAGKFKEAVAQLAKASNSKEEAAITRLMILPELGDPAAAYETWKSTVERIPLTSFNAALELLPLQLMGRSEEAVARFKELAPRLQEHSRNDWYVHLVEFEAGMRSEEDILKESEASQWNRCEVHFYIGLMRLSKGDRAGARVEFEKCLDTPVYFFFEYRWSRAFLKRMDADPRWPHALAASPATAPS
jgi:hypothetical protein